MSQTIPREAFVVMASANPLTTTGVGVDWKAVKPVSIHLSAQVATQTANDLKLAVFASLASGNDGEEFVARMLAYRASITVETVAVASIPATVTVTPAVTLDVVDRLGLSARGVHSGIFMNSGHR